MSHTCPFLEARSPQQYTQSCHSLSKENASLLGFLCDLVFEMVDIKIVGKNGYQQSYHAKFHILLERQSESITADILKTFENADPQIINYTLND